MWILEDKDISPSKLELGESLFSLGNGYLGVRGAFEEGYPEGYRSIRGTYINGVYDLVDIKYGEKLSGFPEVGEKLPNIIDSQTVKIYLDGEQVSLFRGKHENYVRTLHMDKGYSERTFDYRSPKGKDAHISIRRMISHTIKELFTIDVRVDYPGEIRIATSVDPNVTNFTDKFDPRVASGHSRLLETALSEVDGSHLRVVCKTKRSGITIGCDSTAKHDSAISSRYYKNEDGVLWSEAIFENEAAMTKYSVYTDSRYHEVEAMEGAKLLYSAVEKGIERITVMQEDYLREFWQNCDVKIYGDMSIQQATRFNMFSLIQSVGKDQLVNISAKGLSGEGYEGHYFWDTEIYVIPVFELLDPSIAESLLKYRYHMLDSAREEARILGHKRGVKYPWRTIAGRECSGFFPAGTAQYHINGDVAYSYIQHYHNTLDKDFMVNFGLEVLIETSRMWLELGNEVDGKFMIHSVTGPDEYTCVVDNNYYTNLLAKYGMHWTAKLYDELSLLYPREIGKLSDKIGLFPQEIADMRRASEIMYLPYSKELGIYKQDDSFLNKETWDIEGTPEDMFPLLLHYHPLTIYRYQVIKQADTVLAHMLLEDEAEYEDMKRSFDYYEGITTHDSSLSSCIHGIMASKFGYDKKAYDYFMESIRLDLDNTHKNTKDGLHIANLGGAIMSVVHGFGGYRIKEGGLELSPRRPYGFEGYSFKVHHRGSVLKVKVLEDITLKLIKGDSMDLKVYGNTVSVNSRVDVTIGLKG